MTQGLFIPKYILKLTLRYTLINTNKVCPQLVNSILSYIEQEKNSLTVIILDQFIELLYGSF